MNLGSRVIQKMRSSKFVSLPKEFLQRNNINAGDDVKFFLGNDESLIIKKSTGTKTGVLCLGKRTVQNIRYSKCVIVPKIWLDSNNIKAGIEVEFNLRKDDSLSLKKVVSG